MFGTFKRFKRFLSFYLCAKRILTFSSPYVQNSYAYLHKQNCGTDFSA